MFIKNDRVALKNWVDSRKLIDSSKKQQVKVTARFVLGTEEYLVSGYMKGYLFNKTKNSEVFYHDTFEELYEEHLAGVNWMANIGRGPTGSGKTSVCSVAEDLAFQANSQINLQ